jgi:hypothetical protein
MVHNYPFKRFVPKDAIAGGRVLFLGEPLTWSELRWATIVATGILAVGFSVIAGVIYLLI